MSTKKITLCRMLVHKGFHFMKSLFFVVNIDVHIHLFALHFFILERAEFMEKYFWVYR